jgi:ATP-dependent DNA helicase RecG
MSHLNTEYVIKAGPREEILELPEEALREAILNAIAHRDYRSTTTIQVHIFQDRLEIINPGGLVSGLKLKDLGRVSRPRNLLLFSLMARMDLVEQIGSGIKRIREAVRTYGLKPPLIEADAEWFSIIFWRKTQHDAIEKSRRKETLVTPSHEGLSEGVNEGVARLMEFVRKNPGFRTPQISKEIDVPIKTLERWLKQLRNEGKIEFRGSPKTGGYWETA